MATNFYCGRESDLANGALEMASVISAEPERFGLTAAQCEEYSALASQFSEVLKQSLEPITRTSVVVAKKRTLKQTLKKRSFQIGEVIRASGGVSDADVVALGLNLRKGRTPRPTPAESPRVHVSSVRGRTASLRIYDAQSQTRRSKPLGVLGAAIFSHVGENAPENPTDYQFQGLATRSKSEVTFPDSVPSGATVWISARWQTARGKCSIASAPICFTLTGGVVVPG